MPYSNSGKLCSACSVCPWLFYKKTFLAYLQNKAKWQISMMPVSTKTGNINDQVAKSRGRFDLHLLPGHNVITLWYICNRYIYFKKWGENVKVKNWQIKIRANSLQLCLRGCQMKARGMFGRCEVLLLKEQTCEFCTPVMARKNLTFQES